VGWLVLAGALGLLVLWGLLDFVLYLIRETRNERIWDDAHQAADRLHVRHGEALRQMRDSAE